MPSNKGTQWATAGALGTVQLFQFYKNNGGQLKESKYRKVLQDLNSTLMREIIQKGRAIKLPHLNSRIRIVKYKTMKAKCIDFKHYNKTGEKSFHMNFDTDNFICKFYWDKMASKINALKVYTFKATRDNTRAASAVMKENHKLYVERL